MVATAKNSEEYRFGNFQSGFKPGHGKETTLVVLMDDLEWVLDWGGTAILVFLLLSEIFDRV